MKKGVVIILFLIFLIGIYFINSHSDPPVPNVTTNNKIVPTAPASYCWNGLLRAECVDTISPPEIIKHHDLKPIVVSAEAKIKVEFKTEPLKDTLRASIWIQDKPSESAVINHHFLTAPKEKGVYIFNLFASWGKGDANYVFVIEVQ